MVLRRRSVLKCGITNLSHTKAAPKNAQGPDMLASGEDGEDGEATHLTWQGLPWQLCHGLATDIDLLAAEDKRFNFSDALRGGGCLADLENPP